MLLVVEAGTFCRSIKYLEFSDNINNYHNVYIVGLPCMLAQASDT
jgi:hypothetical protein